MSQEIEKRGLTRQAQQVAFFDAQGMSVKEIADATGMHEKSISRYRADPRYKEELAKWQGMALSKLEPLLAKLRLEVVDAHQRALGVALDMLEAEDHDGNPLWSIRMKGAELILNSPAAKALVDPRSFDAGAGAIAAAQATVTLVVKRDDSGGEVIEYHGEVEEVTHEPGDVPEDGDDPAGDKDSGG